MIKIVLLALLYATLISFLIFMYHKIIEVDTYEPLRAYYHNSCDQTDS